MTINGFWRSAPLFAVAFFIFVGDASAQLEEIIVTARKREESLQEIALQLRETVYRIYQT
jgi:hypothetical protein